MDKVRILGFAGSLREGSYNRALLRVAQTVVPDDAELETFDIEGIPLFNQDLESNPPRKLHDFKTRIRAADAILIVTPEYNYSIPGVLKNAIDCASRPYGDNAFSGKTVAVMGASVGTLGTARAQYHLRQCFLFLEMHPLSRPEVMVANAAAKFDDNGQLTDPETAERVRGLLDSLVAWTRRLAQ
jgi:chromate reductase, NAD(P)H dehydrogenase (quinone)